MLKNLNFLRYRKYQRIIIAAVCVALASQIGTSAFTKGNMIALSAFLLPVFLYFNHYLLAGRIREKQGRRSRSLTLIEAGLSPG